MKIEYNNGKKTLRFEHYKVIEKADNYFAISFFLISLQFIIISLTSVVFIV